MSPFWRDLLRAAAAMGVPPEAFWRLSVCEWRVLSEGPSEALERAAFEALCALHPDDRPESER